MAVYAGSSPKYLIRLRNQSGIQLDPSNLLQVTEVKVIIFNAINGAVIARFYLRTSPGEGWTQMVTKDLGDGDVRVLMVLTPAMTLAAKGNSNMIQVEFHVPDTDVPGGSNIILRQGKFHEILPAKA